MKKYIEKWPVQWQVIELVALSQDILKRVLSANHFLIIMGSGCSTIRPGIVDNPSSMPDSNAKSNECSSSRPKEPERRKNFPVNHSISKPLTRQVSVMSRRSNSNNEPRNLNLQLQRNRLSSSLSTIELPDVSRKSESTARVLTFKEYKKWLNQRRSYKVTATPVTTIKSSERCKTATLRKKMLCSSSLENLDGSKKPPTPIPRQVFINCERNGRKSSESEKSDDSGIFDLSNLAISFPKTKNRIQPMKNMSNWTSSSSWSPSCSPFTKLQAECPANL